MYAIRSYYAYAGDIAAALLTIAEQSLNGAELPWGVYHFAGEPHVSWRNNFV